MTERPSYRELNKKLLLARALVAQSKWAYASTEKVPPQFFELGLDTAEEQTAALSDALGEVTPDHYNGFYPPEKAYEPGVRDEDLWVFFWESRSRCCKMWFRFCLKKGMLYVVSFHRSKEKKY